MSTSTPLSHTNAHNANEFLAKQQKRERGLARDAANNQRFESKVLSAAEFAKSAQPYDPNHCKPWRVEDELDMARQYRTNPDITGWDMLFGRSYRAITMKLRSLNVIDEMTYKALDAKFCPEYGASKAGHGRKRAKHLENARQAGQMEMLF